MGGEVKEEFVPLLPAGFHPRDLDGVRALCVAPFTQSVTRPRLMEMLCSLVAMFATQGIVGRVWLDGSFLTAKENPDDVDLVLELSGETVAGLTPEQEQFVKWFNQTNLRETHKCDNYILVRDGTAEAEYLYAYWLKQFGFSRRGEFKGLAVLDLPQPVSP